jgi:hypothetical protein
MFLLPLLVPLPRLLVWPFSRFSLPFLLFFVHGVEWSGGHVNASVQQIPMLRCFNPTIWCLLVPFFRYEHMGSAEQVT